MALLRTLARNRISLRFQGAHPASHGTLPIFPSKSLRAKAVHLSSVSSAMSVFDNPEAASGWQRGTGKVIDFSVGQPSQDLLPLDLLKRGLDGLIERCGSGSYDVRFALNYGDNYGNRELNTALADFLTRHYRHDVAPDDLMITNGNSSGLELICSVLCSPGDVVLVENPTYFLARGIFENHRLRCVGVATDEHGVRPDALEAAFREHPEAKFLYTVPTFNNPTTATLTAERRQAMADLLERHQKLVVADDVYQLLHFDDEAPPPTLCHYTKRAISLGSFSKIVSPGLRVGWLQCRDWDLLTKMVLRAYLVSGGGLNPFTASLMYSLICDKSMDAHIAELRATLRRRQQALTTALAKALPQEATFDAEPGGYFVWVRIPGVDFGKLAPVARAEFEVGFTPGNLCSVGRDSHHDCARLCFAYYPEDKLVEGVQRFARLIAQARAPA